MKTGGTSFAEVLADNFTESERYPDPREKLTFFENVESYIHVPVFLKNVNKNSDSLRMVSAHLPYATRSLLQKKYVVLTVLRDPVERTISYLKHCRRYHIEHKDVALEAIYDDPWFRATFIQNYQTKIFSMTPEETLAEHRFDDGSPIMPSREEMGDGLSLSDELVAFRERAPGRFCMEFFAPSTGVIKIDEQRLQTAKNSLDEIEVVGITQEFDRFLIQLAQRYQWKIKSIPRMHVGESEDIPVDFRNRIARDNEFDLELFEYARLLSH